MSENPITSKIVMTGCTGVGKTSLLAAMYPLLETHFPSGDYKLVPEENTRAILDELRRKLAKLGEGGIKVTDKQITGTQAAAEFNFALQYTGAGLAADSKGNPQNVTHVALQIFDIPGAYCTDDSGRRAQTYLDGSDISFWCLDSTALMENGGQYNESVNAPQAMADCIRRSKLKAGHTICIVLMRSEKYEQDKTTGKLFEKFREKFGSATASLRSNTNIGEIYYCSIMTTGNLRFAYYEGTSPVFIRHVNMSYSPEHCELPVLTAVRRSLKAAVDDAAEKINDMYINAPPFFRWLPPWSLRFAKDMDVAVRLSARLKKVQQDINGKLQTEGNNKRLFKW